MTIASTVNRVDYTGSGTTSVFAYPFKIFESSDLEVTQTLTSTGVETTLALTTGYTVSGVGEATGGNITLVAGVLATGYTLAIRRVLDLVQETDIRNLGEYYPELHENQFDKLVMLVQQLQEQVGRSLKLPKQKVGSAANSTLPGLIASKYVGFNASGGIVASTGTSVTATTKGDISVGTGTGVAALPVGSRDQALIVDPDDTNGIKWSGTAWTPNPFRRVMDASPVYSQATALIGHPTAWVALYGTGSNDDDANGAFVKYTSAASLNAYCGPEWNVAFPDTLGQPRHRLRAYFKIRIPSTITSVRYMIGLGSNRLGPAAIPNLEVACFRYDSSTDGTAFWRTVTNTTGGAGTVTTTTAAFTANTVYRLMIDYTGTSPKFYVDDVLVATHGATLPSTSADLGLSCIGYTLSTGARAISVSRMWGSGD